MTIATFGPIFFLPSVPTSPESGPNNVAPTNDRIFHTPDSGGMGLVFVVDGTSVVVTPWVRDPTSKTWIQLAASQTVFAGNFGAPFLMPADADCFLQVGTNTGPATKLGVVPMPQNMSPSVFASPGSSSLATEATLAAFSAKLPAAAAQANASAYGNLSRLGALLLASNGATADLVLSGQIGVLTSAVGLLNSIGVGRYNLTPPTLADGNLAPLQFDANGNLKVAEQFVDQAVDNVVGVYRTEQRWSKAYITTATTTQVFSGTGLVHSLVVNKAIASGTITILDNTSGTTANIGIVTYGSSLLNNPPDVVPLDLIISTGLRIVTSGAFDLTVLYRAP